MRENKELVFLGTGVSSGFPAWYCDCELCKEGRKDTTQRRTRSSIALLGTQTTLIDASPDLSWQLNRENISHVDQLFVTHWHSDHIQGLAFLGEASMLMNLDPLDVYIPAKDIQSFNAQMPFIKDSMKLHPLDPGAIIDLPDASIEAVKTRHTEASLGYIINAERRFAYLLDTGHPSSETIERLKGIDFLIIEATVDSKDGEEAKKLFSGHLSWDEALQVWKEVGCPECIFTHFAYHRVMGTWGSQIPFQGFSNEERRRFQEEYLGLTLAYDGMRIPIS